MEIDWEDFLREYGERISERTELLQSGLEAYLEYKESHQLHLTRDDAASAIATLYYAIMKTCVTNFIPEKASRYKMAAGTSFAIVKVQPFGCEGVGADELRVINGEFACFVSDSIINNMTDDISCKLTAIDEIDRMGNVGIEDRLKKMLEDHEQWISRKDVNTYPIFSTAAFLEVLWMYTSIRMQAGVAH